MSETTGTGLPERLQIDLEEAARAQGRPVVELLIGAVDRYLLDRYLVDRYLVDRYLKDKQWQSLKSYGRQKALERGLEEGDVQELIAQSRHERGR
jgi:hypothetical protein